MCVFTLQGIDMALRKTIANRVNIQRQTLQQNSESEQPKKKPKKHHHCTHFIIKLKWHLTTNKIYALFINANKLGWFFSLFIF